MVIYARLCERARLAFFSARLRHFEFLDCETLSETPNGFAKKSTLQDVGNHLKNETARPVKFD